MPSDDDTADVQTSKGAQLGAARLAARTRFGEIAELLKREAGIRRHYPHKSISGVAWPGKSLIVAPEGVTRRQLYVVAHECAHIILHSTPNAAQKPNHVKEHEAEVYAHRAFARYRVEVPEKSAWWARAYVGQWIMKDRKAGIPICPLAAAWASGARDANAPLSAVDGHPKDDFSKALDRTVSRALRVIEKTDAKLAASGVEVDAAQTMSQKIMPPNACGTCDYFEAYEGGIQHHSYHRCKAHGTLAATARVGGMMSNHGQSWRPSRSEIEKLQRLMVPIQPQRRGFLARLGDVIIERLRRRD